MIDVFLMVSTLLARHRVPVHRGGGRDVSARGTRPADYTSRLAGVKEEKLVVIPGEKQAVTCGSAVVPLGTEWRRKVLWHCSQGSSFCLHGGGGGMLGLSQVV